MLEVKTASNVGANGLSLIYSGKVRDVYRLNEEQLLLVATDRISAFDCVFPNSIPRKGEVLTALSAFWFKKLNHLAKNHLITVDIDEMPAAIRHFDDFRGRSTLVKKAAVFPVECIVRGYLEGSGWKDYQATGAVCGHRLPSDLKHCEKLPQPVFTPATKAQTGHDINITEKDFAGIVGVGNAEILKSISLEIYRVASLYAATRGIIIADTKFEFGADENGDILLIDEILTPDSSRFWSLGDYQPGRAQSSFDKQFVREYLETLNWDKKPPAPILPDEIVEATTARYLQAFQILTGKEL